MEKVFNYKKELYEDIDIIDIVGYNPYQCMIEETKRKDMILKFKIKQIKQ